MFGAKAIRVLVADDSPLVRQLLTQLIDEQPDMVVVGSASSGVEAIREARRLEPDLVTMDLYMAGIDGVDATRAILASVPTAIALVTTPARGPSGTVVFQAFEAGALDVLTKPPGERPHALWDEGAFVRRLRAAALAGRAKRERRAAQREPRRAARESEGAPVPLHTFEARGRMSKLSLLAVGASIGGPPCLRVLLSALDPERAPPVLVVQHLVADFIPGLAAWLDESIACKVAVARAGEVPQRGTVYLAPGGAHLTLLAGGRLALAEGPSAPEHASVDALFDSIAASRGADTAGVLLTGMGSDGALGLSRMREAGSWTFAQDEASSTAYGMPAEAARLGAVGYAANPVHLGRLLAGAVYEPLAAVEPVSKRRAVGQTERSAT